MTTYSIASVRITTMDLVQLYHLTLRPPTHSTLVAVGRFQDRTTQDIVVALGLYLHVYRAHEETGKLKHQLEQNVFAHVQAVAAYTPAGLDTELLLIAADLGTLTAAQLVGGRFRAVALGVVGKPGMSRLSPGPFLGCGPGAVLVGALQKTKLVFKAEADPETRQFDWAAPLESTHPTLVLALVGMAGENTWAALETKDGGAVQLVYYQLDLGLNHVARKPSFTVANTASSLVLLPQGGLLVCCAGYAIYTSADAKLLVPFPVRKGTTPDNSVVVASVVHRFKKNAFVLLQTALGDLLKVSVAPGVSAVSVAYYDTVPISSALCVLKAGFLFANSVSKSKYLYQIELLGDKLKELCGSEPWNDDWGLLPPLLVLATQLYTAQGLRHLALVDIVDTLAPLMGLHLLQAGHDTQIATLASHAYIKTLTHGVPVLELVSLPLPMRPTGIHTTKKRSTDTNDQYLVLSSVLSSTTLVLSIGEVVEEVADSGLVLDQHTILIQQMGRGGLVQVHANGVRITRRTPQNPADEADAETPETVSLSDWFPPAGITILQAGANHEQLMVALSNNELCYFELDTDDQLIEYQRRHEAPAAVTAVCVAAVLEKKSRFAVFATADETVTVLSLQPHNCLAVASLQALSATCRLLVSTDAGPESAHVHMGMDNGVYVRVCLDKSTGKLLDTRLKYLGTKPVQLQSVRVPGSVTLGILAISSRPWLGYATSGQQFTLAPLLGTALTSGASFYSEDIGSDSLVAFEGSTLSILTLGEDLSNEFVCSETKLRYTPKKMLWDGHTCFVVQSDPHTQSPYKLDDESASVDVEYYDAFGYTPKQNAWASCLQAVDHPEGTVTASMEFPDTDCPTAICSANFNGKKYIVVAVTNNAVVLPPLNSGLTLYLIQYKDNKFELVHTTKVDAEVTAMVCFSHRLVVGVAGQLRIYELGKKQFLRKTSSSVSYFRRITQIQHIGGDVLLVADAQSALLYLQYDTADSKFYPFATDIVARPVTAFKSLDERTVIGGDKFGNVFVSRIPPHMAEQVENNVLLRFQEDYLGGPASRLSRVCDFYVQDIPTSFEKGSFVMGGTESIVYTGIMGTIGLFLPMSTVQEAKFVASLETHMRKHLAADFDELSPEARAVNVVGRDHLKYRSYYNAVKNVIDGDFVEQFHHLSVAAKVKIAGKLNRTPQEVERKLYDLRNRAAI